MAKFMTIFMTFIGLSAIVGYLFQVQHVSKAYFEYKAVIHWLIVGFLHMPMPRLHICFDLVDALNRDKLREDLDINLKRKSDPDFDNDFYLKLVSRLTIRQIFQLTPLPDEILSTEGNACSFRYPNVFVVKHAPDMFCQQLMKMTKYLHKSSVCYRLQPLVPDPLKEAYRSTYGNESFPPLNIQEYASTMDDNRKVYEVFLNKNLFPNLTTIGSFVELPGSSPYQDSVYSLEYPLERSKWLINIMLYPGEVVSDRLPPPYVTQCQDIPGFKTVADSIMYNGNKATIEQFNKYTPFGHIKDPNLDFPIIGVADLQNVTFLKMLFGTLKPYMTPDKIECHLKLTTTDGFTVPYTKNLAVSIIWPRGENYHSIYEPYQLLSEYIIFMFSCLGFWFGTSYLTVWSDLADIKKFYLKKSDRIEPQEMFKPKKEMTSVFSRSLLHEVRSLKQTLNFLASKVSVVESDVQRNSIEQQILMETIRHLTSDPNSRQMRAKPWREY